MKTNCKLSNTNFKFSKNLYTCLVAPILIVILAVVLAVTVGVSKHSDLMGGEMLSVVVGTHVNLEEKTQYNNVKEKVNNILKNNNASGRVYTVEVNEMQEYTMVVKFRYNGEEANKGTTLETIKVQLSNEFHSGKSQSDIDNNNLVIVSSFGSSLDNSVVLKTILACFVAVVVVCAYIALRMGLNSGILSLIMSIFNCVFAVSVIVVTRIPLTYATLSVIPFVSIFSVVASIIFLKKAKDVLTSTNKYEKQSNYVLADDTVKQTIGKQILLAGVTFGSMLLFGLFNIMNSVLFLSMAFLSSVAVMLYSNLFILPGIFARTYIRKFKKAKAKEVKTEKKLTEEEIMKETDLDNLVSN